MTGARGNSSAARKIPCILALLCCWCWVATCQVTVNTGKCTTGSLQDCIAASRTRLEPSETLNQEVVTTTTALSINGTASAEANNTVTEDAEIFEASEGGVTVRLVAGAAVLNGTSPSTKDNFTIEEIPRDFPTTALRNAIQDRNVDAIAEVLQSFEDVEALAEGIRIPEENKELVLARTEGRNDSDVACIKGIAKAALSREASIVKLANVVILSLTPKGGFPPGYSTALLKAKLLRAFTDDALMREVLEDDPVETERRKLLLDGGQDANSLYCAYCWKRKICKRTVWWC